MRTNPVHLGVVTNKLPLTEMEVIKAKPVQQSYEGTTSHLGISHHKLCKVAAQGRDKKY